MAKFCKKSMLIVVLAICLVASIALVACNNDPEPVSYSVTVKLGDTQQPASGVAVSVKQGGATYDAKTTGSDGKVAFDLLEGNYDIALSSLPEHYSVPADANLKLSKDERNLTVTLARNFAYVIKLVNPDNTPFYAENVEVGICLLSGNCLEGVAIDTNGVAYVEASKSDYHVQILGLPENYAYECDEHNYYTGGQLSDTITEMTIKIYPVNVIKFDSKEMTPDEKADYNIDSTLKAYKFTKELASGESAYYSLKAPMSGKYGFISKKLSTSPTEAEPVTYLHSQDDTLFQVDMPSVINGFMIMDSTKTHYIKLTNNGSATKTAEFIFVCPEASYIALEGVGGTRTVMCTRQPVEDGWAIIQFTPTQAGKYTLTVKGDVETAVSTATTENGLGNFVDGSTISTKLTSDKLGTSLYFAVAIKADEYPATAEITIKQDLKFTNGVTTVQVTEQLTQQTKPENKQLEKVPMNIELTPNNGKYYYNGELVYVVITKPLEVLMNNSSLAYFDLGLEGMFSYLFDLTTENDKLNLEKDSTMKDYYLFIRGFKKFNEKYNDNTHKTDYTIPDTLDNDNCYANYVNEDGAYPLTGELMTFLKDFYTASYDPYAFIQKVDLWDVEYTEGNEWMFALYYYADTDENEEPTETDAIVGTYKFTSISIEQYEFDDNDQLIPESKTVETFNIGDIFGRSTLTEESYACIFNKDGTFTIQESDFMGPYDRYFGEWEKNGETYTITHCEDGNDEWETTISFNSTTGTLTIRVADNFSEYPTYVFQKVVEEA